MMTRIFSAYLHKTHHDKIEGILGPFDKSNPPRSVTIPGHEVETSSTETGIPVLFVQGLGRIKLRDRNDRFMHGRDVAQLTISKKNKRGAVRFALDFGVR